MRKVHIDDAAMGVRLAKAIFSSEGNILLASGTELKESYIDRLKAHNITEVYLDDDISRDIIVEDIVCEQTRHEAKALVKNLMNNYKVSCAIDVDKVKDIVNNIIEELLSSRDILVNLSEIRSVDDYTFEHSVNVCILSLIIGIGLEYSLARLRDLGIGALLHDIGKLRIPEEILKKPSQLTVEEFEEIKKHTLYGYEILKNNSNVSMISAFIAFSHHERCDGSGYPLQVKDNDIHHCARIVAVADVYDALTSDRVYRSKMRPHEVFEYITSLRHHHFDQDVTNSFLKYITMYPVGSGVVLSSKESGIVVRVNKKIPTRPVVRIIYNRKGGKLKNFREIDLAKTPGIYIVDSIDL